MLGAKFDFACTFIVSLISNASTRPGSAAWLWGWRALGLVHLGVVGWRRLVIIEPLHFKVDFELHFQFVLLSLFL